MSPKKCEHDFRLDLGINGFSCHICHAYIFILDCQDMLNEHFDEWIKEDKDAS